MGATGAENHDKPTASGSAVRARQFAKLIEKDISTDRRSSGSWLKQSQRFRDAVTIRAILFDQRSRVLVTLTREKNMATLLARTVRDHYDIVERLRRRDKPGLIATVREHVLAGLEIV